MQQDIHFQLLQLNLRLERYISDNRFECELSFGYFLNRYTMIQGKPNKHFATEVGVKHAAISQYLNNRRKPTNEFLVRLELHSNGIIPAITWFKLLQKEKEHEIITDTKMRDKVSKQIKATLNFMNN